MNQKTIFTHLGKVVVKDSAKILNLYIDHINSDSFQLVYNKNKGILLVKDSNNEFIRKVSREFFGELLELKKYSDKFDDVENFNTIINHLEFKSTSVREEKYTVLKGVLLVDDIKNPKLQMNAPYLVLGPIIKDIQFDSIITRYIFAEGYAGTTKIFKISGPLKITQTDNQHGKLSNEKNDYFFASKHNWNNLDIIVGNKINGLTNYELENNLN